MGGAHNAFDAPDAAAGRGHGSKSEYSCSANAGRVWEQGPGWPGWDGLEQALARPARGAVRARRLGSLTSTSTARGIEDIVRHCHGHREIITEASLVELRFHSRSTFPLEQLKIKTCRGETNAGTARSGPDTHGTADPRFAVSSDFVRRHLSRLTAVSGHQDLVTVKTVLPNAYAQERSSMACNMRGMRFR